MIKRPFEDFNKNCGYKVRIGNERIVELRNGEEITIETNAETEKIKGKILWCCSKELKLSDTASIDKFEISGNKFLNQTFPLLAMIPFFGAVVMMNSNQDMLKYFGLGLLILLIVFVIIVLTFKKDKWLTIKRVR